jgi:hypothetical protein
MAGTFTKLIVTLLTGGRQAAECQTRIRPDAPVVSGGTGFRLKKPVQRLTRDYGRLHQTTAGLHLLALTRLMLHRFLTFVALVYIGSSKV